MKWRNSYITVATSISFAVFGVWYGSPIHLVGAFVVITLAQILRNQENLHDFLKGLTEYFDAVEEYRRKNK